MSSIIRVNNRCNHNCVFCSAYYEDGESDEDVMRQIQHEDDQIVLTGGEPLMKDELLKFVKEAREQEPEELELQTNGSLLYYEDYARNLVEAGVDLFNVNFPSHKEKVFNSVTQTEGHYDKVVEGIQNLLGLGADVRLTKVTTTMNMDFVPYVRFINDQFSGLKLLEFNPVKVMGRVEDNKELVPSMDDLMENDLKEAMGLCEEFGIDVLVDGVPLCYMQGYEHFSIDLIKVLNSQDDRLHADKEKAPRCEGCSLNKICLGFREGYTEVNGDEAKPQDTDPERLKNILD